jgi:hypothetical protein
MNLPDFHNRLRSLFNIDGDLLPELSRDEQAKFVRDPVAFFLQANGVQTTAIWREIEKRHAAPKVEVFNRSECIYNYCPHPDRCQLRCGYHT